MHTTTAPQSAPTRSRYSWRVVDIVVAAVLGVACGLIFWIWNSVGMIWFTAVNAITPGLGGMATGVWFLGAIIGALVIRKPGAALFVEVIAATVSALIGNVWGIETLYSGLVQGLGAELVFALLLYRAWGIPAAALAGVGAGAGAIIFEYITGNIAKSVEFNLIYTGTVLASGAILAGVLGWFLVRALAASGALSSFAVGREARRDV
ncbi:MAG: ECF transporter S component [Mycetocola sp.]